MMLDTLRKRIEASPEGAHIDDLAEEIGRTRKQARALVQKLYARGLVVPDPTRARLWHRAPNRD